MFFKSLKNTEPQPSQCLAMDFGNAWELVSPLNRICLNFLISKVLIVRIKLVIFYPLTLTLARGICVAHWP